MVSPTPESLIANLRPDIQGVFEEFGLEINQQRMIALQVMPIFDVDLQAGPWAKITLESLLKAAETARSTGGYNSADFEFGEDTYSTKENGIKVPVDQRLRSIYSNLFDAEVVAARIARHIVMTNLEVRVAGKLFNAGTFTPTAVANEWDDHAACTPIDDVEAGVQRLYDKGVIANALVINWKVFRNLRHSEQIIERINSGGAGQASKPEDITVQMLATVFALDRVIVGGAQRNSAKEGQTGVLAPIWSNEYAAVTRVTSGAIDDPGWGRTFHWDGDGSSPMGTLETYYSEDDRAEIVRCRMETEEKVIYPEAVELLSNITT